MPQQDSSALSDLPLQSPVEKCVKLSPVKCAPVDTTGEKAQIASTETLLSSLGAVSVTLDDAENQDLLEPLPGETPLWNKVIVTGIYAQEEGEEIDVAALEPFIGAQMPEAPIKYEFIEDQAWERTW